MQGDEWDVRGMGGRWQTERCLGGGGMEGVGVDGCNKPHALLQAKPSQTLHTSPPDPLPTHSAERGVGQREGGVI